MAAAVAEAMDLGWKGLYRIGGISAMGVGILYVIGTGLAFALPFPFPAGEAGLRAIAGVLILYRIFFGLFALTDFLIVPVVLALYLALKGINKNVMLLASGILGLFLPLDLGVNYTNNLALATLSQNYVATTSEAQRAAYEAVANYIFAEVSIGVPVYGYILPSVGILIISLVMLKGIFGKGTAYAGISASVLGILAGFSYWLC